MSYILEALRRAEAERARGAVPGLNTPAPETVDDGADSAPRPWSWLAGGVVVALAIVVGWRWSTTPGEPQAPVVASAPVAMTSPPVVEARVAQAPVVQAPTVQASAVQAPATASAVIPAPEPRTEPTSPSPSPSRRTAAVKEAPVRRAPPVTAAASAAAAPRAEPAKRIYRQAELPEDIRRALPRLSIGGSIYSESAASRMIIINGQVMHEGERVGPDLELHQIRMKEAVLDFRGYRYEVPY